MTMLQSVHAEKKHQEAVLGFCKPHDSLQKREINDSFSLERSVI